MLLIEGLLGLAAIVLVLVGVRVGRHLLLLIPVQLHALVAQLLLRFLVFLHTIIVRWPNKIRLYAF